MLQGLWFVICTLLIIGSSLAIVGTLIAVGWTRNLAERPRKIAPSLVALTVALLPDFAMLVNRFTNFRMIHVIPNNNNVALFSEWQIISGILIAMALLLSYVERNTVRKITLWGSIILLVIHGAGTVLFFS